MYHFVDQPAGMLCKTGRLLLWSMRAWRMARDRGTCAPVMLRRSFAEWNLLGVLGHFDVAMTLIDTGGMAIAPLQQPLIAEDEAVLLGLWQDMAAKDAAHLKETLALMIGEPLASPVSLAMGTVVAGLEHAGFTFVGMTAAPAAQ